MSDEARVDVDNEWRTFHRVWPLDLYNEVKHFDSMVADAMGLPPDYKSIGVSTEVWTVITQHLRDTQDALVALAKEKATR
jgi:hypothetical protein